MKNNVQFIQQQLNQKLSFADHINGLKLGLLIEFRTLISGKKWLIYYLLGIFPILISLLGREKLFGNDDAAYAFVDIFIASTYMLMFTFGCLLISLPISSDEISDNVLAIYLIKPISRYVLWITRWIVTVLGVIVVTSLINITYFLYFHLFNYDGIFTHLVEDLPLLVDAFLFTLYAAITYAGIFLFVGFIGEKGFTWGILLAIFESFFLSLLFLQDSPGIPRTNLNNIADSLFGKYYVYESKPTSLTLTNSYWYVFGISFVVFILGMIFVSRKEFKSN